MSRLVFCRVSTFVFTLLKQYESNIGAVSGYRCQIVPTFLEDLITAIAVAAVLFAFAILFVSAVLLFASIFVAIIVVAATAVTGAILLLIFALLLTTVSIFVAAVAVAALRFEVVRSNRLLLFLPF